MATRILTRDDAAPISLYFDTPHNEGIDLAVIARASIAWNDLIKELVSVVDPSLDVRLDFLSGTVGSRSINSILRATGQVALEHPWLAGSLTAVAGVFLLAPPSHVANDVTNHLARVWFGHEDSVLNGDDVERVAQRVVELQRNRNAVNLKGEIYEIASRDERVRGLGALPRIGRPPQEFIVPRSDFPLHEERTVIVSEETVETRIILKTDYPVTIVRSYSKAEERRWRFAHGETEFSATMRDPNFLAAIRSGHTGVEIGERVEMVVDLRIKEERADGVWHEKEIDVVRVVSPSVGRQASLQFSPNKPDEPD